MRVDTTGGPFGEEVRWEFIEIKADVMCEFGWSSCCLLPQE